MFIKKVMIRNFKCFEKFDIDFNDNINIIVGNNNEGKSTIFEAIHLALTGSINGKSVFNDISASLFNKKIVDDYISKIQQGQICTPPRIEIQVFFTDNVNNDYYLGNNNFLKSSEMGVKLDISLSEDCVEEYKEYIRERELVKSLPIEFYQSHWYSFDDNPVSKQGIPVKSNYIDIASTRYINIPDKQVLDIVEDVFDLKDKTNLTLAYRKLKEQFTSNERIDLLNQKIDEKYGSFSQKKVSLNIEVSSRVNWESNFTTYFDDIPFSMIGKGEQTAFKIKMALNSQNDKCNAILIEEPENHLSYSNMSKLIDEIIALCPNYQIIISTHSNYVLNKLNVNRVILLQNCEKCLLNTIESSTVEYFKKIPGYDTLRLILSKKVFLVEGPSDELIIQKLYLQKYGKLPIEDGVDIISVRGTSFARFLDIAKNLKTKVFVIPDNDGKVDKMKEKYSKYVNENIKLLMSEDNDLYTLEKIVVENNDFDQLKSIINPNKNNKEELLDYMIENKTEWALKAFENDFTLNYIKEVYDEL